MSDLISWILSFVVGTVAGLLSGLGIGGGTLLLVYLTTFAGVHQTLAQGINLLYFLPAGMIALFSHLKEGYVAKPILYPAIAAGCVAALLGAWLATCLDSDQLKPFFGLFLLGIGLHQWCTAPKAASRS